MRSISLLSLGLVAGVAAAACGDDGPDCDCAEVGCFADMCTKTVFISATPVPSDLGGITGADSLCAQQAAAAKLPGVFYAWLSDAQTSPFQRFSKSTVPYTLPDGTTFADDWDALTRGPSLPLDVDASGHKVAGEPDAIVWTGTGPDGRPDTFDNAANSCSGWTRNVIEDFAVIGWLSKRTKASDWSRGFNAPCTGTGFVYCFQQ